MHQAVSIVYGKFRGRVVGCLTINNDNVGGFVEREYLKWPLLVNRDGTAFVLTGVSRFD